MSPVNFNSPAQNESRNRMAQLMSAWQQLTTAQRSAWQAWAKFQNLKSGKFASIEFYGQEAFVQTNFYRLMTGESIMTDPIFASYAIGPTTFEVNIKLGRLVLNIDTDAEFGDFRLVCQLSGPQPPARESPRGYMKYMKPAYYDAYEYDIQDAYVKNFGITPTIGTVLFAYSGIIDRNSSTLSAFTKGRYVVANY